MKPGQLADPCDRDYSLPLEVRKWMRLLEHHPITGFRYRPNLNLRADELGFSLRSNALGLRGPEATTGRAAVFGTSFAQGYCVHEGENWYDLCLRETDWMNLAFPGAIPQWEYLGNQYYEGSAELAVVLYYPNIWVNTEGYYRWCDSGQTFASYHRWKDGLVACWKLQRRRLADRRRKLALGQAVHFEENGRRHFLEYRLCCYPWAERRTFVSKMEASLRRIFQRFEKVALFYIPLKEEIAYARSDNPEVRATIESSRHGWQIFQEAAGERGMPFADHPFKLADYHSRDVHWNKVGNRKMAEWLSSSLAAYRTILKPLAQPA